MAGMKGETADVAVVDGQMLGMTETPMMDESGDGSPATGPGDPSTAAEKEPGKLDEKGDTSNTGTSMAKKTDESSLYKQTTVEVCMKMVVFRKYITKTIDSRTGQVVHTSTREEQDPGIVLDVHSYTTTTPATDAITPATTSSVPVTSTRRMPGRPRKHPIVLTAASSTKRLAAQQKSDSMKETVTMPVKGTEDKVDGAVQPVHKTAISEDTVVDSQMSVNSSGEQPTDQAPVVSAQGQTDSTRSSVREQKTSVRSLPVKRNRGRPSRVIKRPRKYLDSYEEEEEDTRPELDTPEQAADNAGEEAESGEHKEENKEESKDEEESGEVEGEEENDTTENSGPQTESVDTEVESSDSKTECPKCGKVFSTSSNCLRHISKNRCSREHQCGFCDKPFSSRILLARHVESHRDQECQNNFRCSDCNRTYATRNGYLKHKRQGTCYKRDVFHEDGTQGEFECDLCRVRFTTEKLLSLHKEKVHENPNNEYKCPDCGRVFYSKLGFSKHTAKKSCTLPHVCKVCGKKYSNKAKESFKSHMRYHLAETSGVQYQCEDCGRVYMTDMALKKHRLTSHSGVRPYKCSMCPKTFPMRYMIRDHERSHTGEKPFLCNLCGTSFSNRGHLYRHMRSHQLGTLHKRGRPRKYPTGKPLVLNFKEEEGEEAFDELMEREGRELGVVEIKADAMQQDVQEEMASSMIDTGPTYITVHTIDGQLTDQAGASTIMEGPHVVMETQGGMMDNMVLQVIRDLTGATTVYQQVAEQPGVSAAPNSAPVQQQIIVSTPAMSTPQLFSEHSVPLTGDQQLQTDQQQVQQLQVQQQQPQPDQTQIQSDQPQIQSDQPQIQSDQPQIQSDQKQLQSDQSQLQSDQPQIQSGLPQLRSKHQVSGGQPRIIVASPQKTVPVTQAQ